jgi:hypothetical protein
VLGAVGGAAYATTVPKLWAASASIELPDVPTYVDISPVGRPPGRTTIDTTGQLAYSEEVLGAIAEATGMTVKQAKKSLTVSAYPLSRVIILTVEAGDEKTAIDGANAAANALVEVRLDSLPGSQREQANQLIRTLRKLSRESVDVLEGFSPVSVRLQTRISDITEDLQKYNNPKSRVVNKAAPGKRVPPHSEVYVTTGAVLGFMVGVAWIWWRPRRRGAVDHLPRLSRRV